MEPLEKSNIKWENIVSNSFSKYPFEQRKKIEKK